MNDKETRDMAVKFFAEDMVNRLDEKAEQGFRRWRHWPKRHLLTRINTKLKKFEDNPKKHAVDIANMLMFIWVQEDDE